jgi:hypothetical protein
MVKTMAPVESFPLFTAASSFSFRANHEEELMKV